MALAECDRKCHKQENPAAPRATPILQALILWTQCSNGPGECSIQRVWGLVASPPPKKKTLQEGSSGKVKMTSFTERPLVVLHFERESIFIQNIHSQSSVSASPTSWGNPTPTRFSSADGRNFCLCDDFSHQRLYNMCHKSCREHKIFCLRTLLTWRSRPC